MENVLHQEYGEKNKEARPSLTDAGFWARFFAIILLLRGFMKILETASVRPGGRLARAVFTKDGKLLFSPGEEITENLLRVLRQWGVDSIAVESDPSAQSKAGSTQPEDVLQAIRDMVRDRFRLHDPEDAYCKAIFDLAVERQGRMMLSKAGKMVLSGNTSPAFQTQRPPQVKMRTLIDSSQRMGTLPVVFHRLVEIINNPDASPMEIGNIVSMDAALTARLLRLVNSPFYAFASRIDSIPRAVTMVGTRQLVMLAMGATLITAFKGVPVSLVNMQSFWAHSISCGAAARQFALFCKASGTESFFVAGLLHDISRLLIYSLLPNHTLYILTESKRRQESVHELEKETLGFGHEDLGAELLNIWRCPKELVDRVHEHHKIPKPDSPPADSVLPAANVLTQALGYGSSGEIYIPPLPALAWEKLGLSPESLLDQCRTLDDKVRELRTLLAPN